MGDYVKVFTTGKHVNVCLYNEDDKLYTIGEKMNALNDDAYMNGYNWEAFFQYYLSKNAPDLLEDMETDPEAGMYVAFYPLTPENEQKAKRFEELIRALVENEEELYRIIREESDEIEWD